MKLLIFTSFLILSSCTQRIKAPINRMISPEAIGHGAEIEYKQMGFSEGLLDFSGSKTDNALTMGSVANRELYLALGVAQKADIFIRIPEQSTSLLGVKVQVLGEPSKGRSEGHKLAFSVAMGAERDSFEGTYDVKLKSNAQDFSLIHGYRLNSMILLYDSITYSKYNFEGTIENAGPSFSSNEFDYTAEKILGLQGGVEVGGSSFKLKLEMAFQKISWTHTESKTYTSFGYSLTAGF
ncbi:MAG: hypothetical protein KC478_02685 [Bacteriovoracaceae bacterium]|nr:hypothetical protein [Bacteriovoracaceae bacterium]